MDSAFPAQPLPCAVVARLTGIIARYGECTAAAPRLSPVDWTWIPTRDSSPLPAPGAVAMLWGRQGSRSNIPPGEFFALRQQPVGRAEVWARWPRSCRINLSFR